MFCRRKYYLNVLTSWRHRERTSRIQVCNSIVQHLRDRGYWKDLFETSGLKETLRWKAWLNVNILFLFEDSFLNKTMGNFQNSGLPNFFSQISDIFNPLLYNSFENKKQKFCRWMWMQKIGILKICTEKIFGRPYDLNLFSIKFNILDSVVNDVYTAKM